MDSLMYKIAFQPSQQTFEMTSITREARGTYEMEANIAQLTRTFEQTCSPQNWCKTSTKPRLWPLVMVGILRVLVRYGPVGISASCQHGWLEDSLFSMINMLGRHVKRYHSSQSAYKNPQISASLWKTWPQVCLTLTSLSNPDGHTNFWGMVRRRSDTLPCRSHQHFWWFCQEEFSSLFDPFFLRCDVFLSSNKITTFQVKVNFRGNAESVEYWVKWIGWFYCNLPASFSYHVKISRFLRFSSCLDCLAGANSKQVGSSTRLSGHPKVSISFSMLVVTRRHFQHLHFFTFYEKPPVLGWFLSAENKNIFPSKMDDSTVLNMAFYMTKSAD